MKKFILPLMLIVGIACRQTTKPLPTLAPTVSLPTPSPTLTSLPTITPSSYAVEYRVHTSSPSPVDLLYGLWSDRRTGIVRDYKEENVSTPWEITFNGVLPEEWLTLHAFARYSSISVTCEIWVNGELWKSETDSHQTGFGGSLGSGLNVADCVGRLGE